MLVDAGLSRKEIVSRLDAIGESPEALDAVLITHEHSDHVCGLIPLLKKYELPVYMSWLTSPTIAWGDYEPRLELFMAGERFRIGDMEVDTFTIPHDAVDPVGLLHSGRWRPRGGCDGSRVHAGFRRIHLRGVQFLLLESNHDLDMLKVGPYPWSVKQRVMGRNGHLSNDMVRNSSWMGWIGCSKHAGPGAPERAQQSSGDRAHVGDAGARPRGLRRPTWSCPSPGYNRKCFNRMIERYTRPEMGRIWSEENKYKQWLEVELAASEALAESATSGARLRGLYARMPGRCGRIAEIEREVRHDVIAFTTCVAESMADAGAAEYSRWFHYGLTSNDVVDTAQALQIQGAPRCCAGACANCWRSFGRKPSSTSRRS